MLNRKRGEFAACTTSDTTPMSRSGLGTASLALFAAGPAGADPTESTRTKEVIVPGDWLDTTLNPIFRRPCGTSPHGTRRHIPDPRGGPDSIIECINGTWVPVD